MATEQLIERQGICDTVHKFCWCIDAKKPLSEYPGCMEEVFTEDFQFGLSRETVKSSSEIKLNPMGRAAFSAFIEKVQGKYESTQHHCTNTVVTFGEASGTCGGPKGIDLMWPDAPCCRHAISHTHNRDSLSAEPLPRPTRPTTT